MYKLVKRWLFVVLLCAACGTDNTMVSDVVFDAATDDVYLVENDIIQEVVEEPSPICPPTGPFGVNTGDFLTDLELPDCDGNIHRLHDLCGARAGFVNLLSGG